MAKLQNRQDVRDIIKKACDYLSADGVEPRFYAEQLAWLFFLKALDESHTALAGSSVQNLLSGEFAWSSWSKLTDSPISLLKFVNGKLWTRLTKHSRSGKDPLALRISNIFGAVRNHSRRAESFAEVVELVSKLRFGDSTEVNTLSEIYEGLLSLVAAKSAGYSGEFYTPRHIVNAVISVLRPKQGELVYDPCFGTAGFLVEAAEYMLRSQPSRRKKHQLPKECFYGRELKPTAYLLGEMNLILHGVKSSHIELGNTLDVHDGATGATAVRDGFDVIVANPPYGARTSHANQAVYKVKSTKTEYLFLQHIMSQLKSGGRAAVVVPESLLKLRGAARELRIKLLKQCKLHSVLSLPRGCFLPYAQVKASVLFFDRPQNEACPNSYATTSVWYYDLQNDGFETNRAREPIDGSQIPDFLDKLRRQVDSPNSWSVGIDRIVASDFDLTAHNPESQKRGARKSPSNYIRALTGHVDQILKSSISLAKIPLLPRTRRRAQTVTLGEICKVISTIVEPDKTQHLQLPYIGGRNIEPGTGRLLNVRCSKDEKIKSWKFLFNDHMVLFNRIRPSLRKVAMPDFAGLCSGDMIPLLPNAACISREYLFYLLLSQDFTQYAVDGPSRSGIPRLDRRHLIKFAFQLPELSEQQEVVDRLSQSWQNLSQLGNHLDNARSNANHLREAMLERAFSGRAIQPSVP